MGAATSSLLSLFRCPMSHMVMEDPVSDPCGHTFERSQITGWLRGHSYCPLSAANPLAIDQLTPNEVIKDAFMFLKAKGEKSSSPEEKEVIDKAVCYLRSHPRLPAAQAFPIRLKEAAHQCGERIIDAAADCAGKTLGAAGDCVTGTVDAAGDCASSTIGVATTCTRESIAKAGVAAAGFKDCLEKLC